ncbi:MAG: hypothetical protein WBG71_01615 [Leeuwenhoekiella sp.]
MEPKEYLDKLYDESLALVGSGIEIVTELDADVKGFLDIALKNSEHRKGMFTVMFTSIVYKTLFPEQDVRKHQASMEGGYSGRGFDEKNVTPFLKSKNFPAPSETGWGTKKLEMNSPYYLDFKAKLTPAIFKNAFLNILDQIESHLNPEYCLSYLIQGLIIRRNSQNIDLAKPANLPISFIIKLLNEHFESKYSSEGASRLPVLALYAIYQCLVNEAKRFEGKRLLPIESHTSADARSGRIGDVDLVDETGKEFEAVEVKFGIPITARLIQGSYEKFKTTQVKRYYLLSTANIDQNDKESIDIEIERIKNIHGCNVIANGLIHSLNYYLRLISDTSEFISNYVDLVEADGALKFEHKQHWNVINSIR